MSLSRSQKTTLEKVVLKLHKEFGSRVATDIMIVERILHKLGYDGSSLDTYETRCFIEEEVNLLDLEKEDSK